MSYDIPNIFAASNRPMSGRASEALKSPEAGKVSHALSAGSIVSAGELLARHGGGRTWFLLGGSQGIFHGFKGGSQLGWRL